MAGFCPSGKEKYDSCLSSFCKKQVSNIKSDAACSGQCFFTAVNAFLHFQDPGFGEFQGQALSRVVQCIFWKIYINNMVESYCTWQVNKILPSGCAFITCQEVKVRRDRGPATWPHLPGNAMKHLRISMIKMLMCTALSGSKEVLL